MGILSRIRKSLAKGTRKAQAQAPKVSAVIKFKRGPISGTVKAKR